ncbi:hypothetical protein QWJ07_16980 [Frankia sp. RB7]|nr:hypothetical protein [Frankia sp. RB7]
MRKSPEVTPPFNGFEKPAKQRMIEASHKVFLVYGIQAIDKVARLAESNLETFMRYFGSGDPLIERFIDTQIAEAEKIWQEIVTDYPDQPEAQLRRWLFMANGTFGGEFDHLVSPEVTLSRTAAELPWHPKHSLLIKIENYWQTERHRVLKLCRHARLRAPQEACDKLLLLVHGARGQRSAFGSLKPMRLLGEAGEDILAAHSCTSKPLPDWDPLDDEA